MMRPGGWRTGAIDTAIIRQAKQRVKAPMHNSLG